MKSFIRRLLLLTALAIHASNVAGQAVSVESVLLEADVLMRNYQYGSALDIMDRAGDTLHADLLQRKGQCYTKLGNYSDAIQVYERLITSDSLNREARYQLGQLYSLVYRHGDAMTCFRKLVELDSANSFYFKQYASAAVRAEDPVGAIAAYLQAVRLNPRDMEALARLSGILLDAEQYHFVDSMLSTVLSTVENRELRLLQARANLGEEKYDAVVENIGMLLASSDTTATFARLLGIAFFQLEEYAKVIPCMDFLLSKGAKADWIYYYLGVSYQQINDPVRAIEFLNLAVTEGISDNIQTYYTQLGMAYEEVKDFGNAIRSYKAAYEQSKADILLYHLARNYDVYYADKKQARIYYRKYLNSDDTMKLAKRYSQYRFDVLSARE